jgi:hypothetical protein
MGIRRPPAILAAAVTVGAMFVAGFFVVVPGSGSPPALPPLSAVEPGAAHLAMAGANPGVSSTKIAAAARGTAPRFLDHRIVDPAEVDRHGNPVRRDMSAAELRRLATEYDVIDDDLRGQPDGVSLVDAQIVEMHRVNPRLLVLRHLSLLNNQDAPFNGIEPGDGSHESWFLKDSAGNDVRLAPDGTGRTEYALDPADLNVRLDVAAQVRQYRILGYDGVVIDDVFPHVPRGDTLMTHPLNSATGEPYSDGEWADAVRGLLEAVRRIAARDVYVAIAGGDAADYVGGDAGGLIAPADGVIVRSFGAAGRWDADHTVMSSLGQRGKGVVAVASGEVSGAFAHASFLLDMPAEGGASFGAALLEGPPPVAYPPQPAYEQVDLGKPLGDGYEIGGVWLRQFERGLVVVNPDVVAHDVALPSPFRAADGAVVDHVSVAGMDAAMLTSAR